MAEGNGVSIRQPLARALARLSRLALRSTGATGAGFYACDQDRGPRWVASAGDVGPPSAEQELIAYCLEAGDGELLETTDSQGRRVAVLAMCQVDEGCAGAAFIRMDSPQELSTSQLESLGDIVASAADKLNLVLSSSRLAALVDHMNAGVLFEGPDRRGQLVNREFCSLFGVLPGDALGLFGGGLLAKARSCFETPGDFVLATNRTVRVGKPEQGERFATRDGRWIERDYVPVKLPHGNLGHLWLFRDVTQDLETEAGLLERNTWLKLLHAVAEMANSTTEERATLERAAGLICEHAGWLAAAVCPLQPTSEPLLLRAGETGEVAWEHLERPLAPGARARTQRTLIGCPISVHGKVETALRFEVAGHMTPTGATLEALAVVANTLSQSLARLRREQEIREQSLIDPLTALYNRRGFMLLGQQQLKLAARQGASLVVFFMDLDGLKSINDEHGHEIGDEAICDAAEALKHSFRSTDIIARLAGDEFCVASVDLGADDVPSVLERLNGQLDAFNASSARPYRLSISVGYAAFAPQAPQTVHELLRTADQDMYRNKQAHKRHIREAAMERSSVTAHGS